MSQISVSVEWLENTLHEHSFDSLSLPPTIAMVVVRTPPQRSDLAAVTICTPAQWYIIAGLVHGEIKILSHKQK